MASSVTFSGSTADDGTTVVIQDGHRFPLGETVTDVPDAVVKKLEARDGYEFDIKKETKS